jgi:predicted transposase/invertase (TIGR01784 family)
LFYKYICEKGNENQQKCFLNSIGVTIKGDLNILKATIAPEIINKKKCILDFLTETDDTLINIELQQEKTEDFNERIIYYMGKITILEKGKIYTEFKKIVLISIINYNMNKIPNYKHKYKMINTKNLSDIFTEKLEIIIIDLKEFRKIKKDFNNKEHLYLTFIDNETNHTKRREMGRMDEGLNAAVKKIEEALQDETALRLYHKLEIEKMVMENEKIRTEERIKEGIEKGRKEGMEINNIKIATKLKNMGIPVQNIVKATDLSKEFIENL